jgi:hypothetical protein
LPGCEELCQQCYLAQQEALIAPQDGSILNWRGYLYSLLWILVSYALLTYLPVSAKVLVLSVGLLAIWYLFFWATSQRPRKRYSIPQGNFSFILGLCCGVVWKITGADVWERLAIACILVSGGYKAIYRAIDRAKTVHR